MFIQLKKSTQKIYILKKKNYQEFEMKVFKRKNPILIVYRFIIFSNYSFICIGVV